MSVAVLCGLADEAAILRGCPGLAVYCGTLGAEKLKANIQHGVKGIVSWGTCGALSPYVSTGTIVVGLSLRDGVRPIACDLEWLRKLPVHYDAHQVMFGAVLSLGVVSADTPEDRARLYREYRCMVIDEESRIAGQLAKHYDLPFLIIRSVVDSAQDTIPAAALLGTNRDGSTDYMAILESLAEDPFQIPALIALAPKFQKSIVALTAYAQVASAIFATP